MEGYPSILNGDAAESIGGGGRKCAALANSLWRSHAGANIALRHVSLDTLVSAPPRAPPATFHGKLRRDRFDMSSPSISSKESPRRLRRAAWIVGIALAVLGFALTVRQIGYLRWPAVNARVTAARILQRQTSDAPGKAQYPIFRPEVTYRYDDGGGQTHEATTLADRWVKTTVEAQRFLDRYPVGSEPRISSNPRDPDQVRFGVGMNVATLWQPLASFAGAALCFSLARAMARAARGRATTGDDH